MLTTGVTVGLALLGMTVFQYAEDVPTDVVWLVLSAVIAAGSGLLLARYLRGLGDAAPERRPLRRTEGRAARGLDGAPVPAVVHSGT
jgi:hypothetical protein